jgi:hypothetical protein
MEQVDAGLAAVEVRWWNPFGEAILRLRVCQPPGRTMRWLVPQASVRSLTSVVRHLA